MTHQYEYNSDPYFVNLKFNKFRAMRRKQINTYKLHVIQYICVLI